MKKKILPIFLIIIILLTNYSIAVEYTREGGTCVNSIATVIDEDTYLDAKYNAKSFNNSSDIKVYEFNSNTEQICSGYVYDWESSTSYRKNKYCILFYDPNSTTHAAYYCIRY